MIHRLVIHNNKIHKVISQGIFPHLILIEDEHGYQEYVNDTVLEDKDLLKLETNLVMEL